MPQRAGSFVASLKKLFSKRKQQPRTIRTPYISQNDFGGDAAMRMIRSEFRGGRKSKRSLMKRSRKSRKQSKRRLSAYKRR